MRPLKLLLVLFVCAAALPAAAGPPEDFKLAVEAANTGDYATALRLWRPLAEQGIANAQFNLGLMYDRGLGVPQNYAEAASWYRRAGEQGNVDASVNLGLMYLYSRHGVAHDPAEAASWFRKAAEQGDAHAQLLLANMLWEGTDMPLDYRAAVSWYRRAAEQGDAAAQINLGTAYEEGKGVVQDYVLAHKWYNLGTTRTDIDPRGPDTKKLLREMRAKYRDEVAAKMTSAQIAEAQKLASEWKPKPER
jgi:TPR repeat protein